MMEPVMSDKLFVGADVSKDWIDIAHSGGSGGLPPVCRIANTDGAIRVWLGQQSLRRIALVCFEPTGGYERALVRCLRATQLPFARVHPNRLVAFRKLRGVLAKTDAQDARLLAEFAAADIARGGLAPVMEADETLRALVVRRRQLLGMIQAEACRLALCDCDTARPASPGADPGGAGRRGGDPGPCRGHAGAAHAVAAAVHVAGGGAGDRLDADG